MGIQYKLIVETSLSLYVRQAQTTGVYTERQGLPNLIRVQTVFLDYLKQHHLVKFHCVVLLVFYRNKALHFLEYQIFFLVKQILIYRRF